MQYLPSQWKKDNLKKMKDDLIEYWNHLDVWLENLGFGVNDIEINPKTGERFVAIYNLNSKDLEEVFVLPKEFQDIPLPDPSRDDDLTDEYEKDE